MATPEQSISELATITGVDYSRVWANARTLRKADRDLWPAGAKGRAKLRHVERHHLGNLAIGLGLAAPETMTITPDRVRGFRMLVRPDGLTFGEALDALIDLAARDISFR